MLTRIATRANAIMVAMFVSVALTACGGGNAGTGGSVLVPPSPGPGSLIAATPGGTLSVAGVAALITALNTGSPLPLSSLPQYPVNFYRVTYRTPDPAGNLTTASGLLLVPAKGARSSPLLSWQHGTLFSESEAPSYANGTPAGTPKEAQLGFITASLGYIVMMPDYLGYGAAKGIFHPYVQARTLASATIDMIRASRAFLSQSAIPVNGQLFLGGYSEGGYATLAAQREMETTLPAEFTITASEPGSGPYDMTATASAVFATTSLAGVTDPRVLAFLFRAYDLYYNTPSQLATYFAAGTVYNCVLADFTTAPTYGTDPALGTFDGCIGNITATASIMNPALLASFNAGGEPALRADLGLNDIYNWAPKARTRLFYSTTDDVVPALNTTNAYAAMVAKGSTQVQTVLCGGVTPATHTNCAVPFIIDLTISFSLLATNL